MKEVTISLPHPVLFIMDFNNSEVVIPECSTESTVSVTSSCVSVRVIADVDGDVAVRFIDEQNSSASPCIVKVFEGPVATPGRRLAVVTSHNEKIMEVNVINNATMIRVSVNDTKFPSAVSIEAL